MRRLDQIKQVECLDLAQPKEAARSLLQLKEAAYLPINLHLQLNQPKEEASLEELRLKQEGFSEGTPVGLLQLKELQEEDFSVTLVEVADCLVVRRKMKKQKTKKITPDAYTLFHT